MDVEVFASTTVRVLQTALKLNAALDTFSAVETTSGVLDYVTTFAAAAAAYDPLSTIYTVNRNDMSLSLGSTLP